MAERTKCQCHREWSKTRRTLNAGKRALTAKLELVVDKATRRTAQEIRTQDQPEEAEHLQGKFKQNFNQCLEEQRLSARPQPQGPQRPRARRTRRSRRSAQRAWKRKRAKVLAWTSERNNYWNDKAQCEIERYRTNPKQQCGFLADPSKMLWENIEAYYGSMDPRTFFIGRPTNMACHNLCIENKAPIGIELLLGLGAGHCVQDTKLPQAKSTI